ncbi:peroxisome biogenesis factor 2 [Anthonomus grandis grandis]|uniref:peroxisome biogenesis factor 2 n=1 Tax=Anthonomus grandis grandis TaxID=2921223 RepID=UPI002165701B|nr:peroxisome biogenesis factor 2 [Anthonomus grandis grandis]
MQKNKLLRVTQMNAIYLDNEIEKSLQHIVQEACKHLPPGLLAPIQPEINLLIHLGILKYSLLNKGATFGQQLLNIHYENITPVKKAAYFLLTSLNYLKTRCELWKPSHRINKIMFGFYILVKMLDFINISVFLRNGAKPLLVERVLGLNQGYASETPPRTFEYKYLARELLWNGFIEIIIYMIPLVNYYKLKRIVKQYSPFSKQSVISNVVTKREFTLNTKCAYCGSSPILPHHMGCAHIFCYVCLKGNQTADPKYECPVCEHRNQNILCDKVNM